MNLARLWWLPMRSELHTAYYDLRARLGGWCNDCPARPDHSGGGYAFWRCELRRGHDGLHRAINYVWTDDGKTSYLPVPPDRGRELPVRARSPWGGRHLTGGYVMRLRRTAETRRRHRARHRCRGGTMNREFDQLYTEELQRGDEAAS